jgi:integrase
MARKVRNALLDSRSARDKLAARGKPHYCTIEPGLHLGYRKLKGVAGRPRVSGKWVLRHYDGDRAYTVSTIATADDFSDADGVAILDFWQATAAARQSMVTRARSAAGKGPCTVEVAIERYLQALEAKGRDAKDTRSRAQAMIVPALGNIEVADLTTDRIRDWIKDLVSTKPRVRTGRDEPQRYRDVTSGKEGLRSRRSTANRIVAILKAALTHAYREGRVTSDEAWRRVKLFENATATRIRYLSVAEAQRLLNTCEPDFRNLVQAALLTGCRYGELCRLTVSDFNPDSDTLAIHQSKSGKPRHVVITEEGAEFFRKLCVGRAGDEVLLPKSNGKPWGPSHQIPLMVAAGGRAKIKPAITFHGLRHTYASLTIMNGAPLMVVAENLGHADIRMVQKHYGHLSKSFVSDAIRAAAPRFGIASTNVESIGRAPRS